MRGGYVAVVDLLQVHHGAPSLALGDVERVEGVGERAHQRGSRVAQGGAHFLKKIL